jgi:hypothetical protein
MSTEMHPIFTDNVLNQLSQLPENTVIVVNKNDITVFADGRDYEDYSPIQHKFFRTTIWADEKDS